MATNTEKIINPRSPLDWVTLRKFAELTGEKESRLYLLKSKLPENEVWHKLHGKIYYSIVGWNKWHKNQATQRALSYEEKAYKLTSESMVNASTSHYHRKPRQRLLAKQESYELT